MLFHFELHHMSHNCCFWHLLCILALMARNIPQCIKSFRPTVKMIPLTAGPKLPNQHFFSLSGQATMFWGIQLVDLGAWSGSCWNGSTPSSHRSTACWKDRTEQWKAPRGRRGGERRPEQRRDPLQSLEWRWFYLFKSVNRFGKYHSVCKWA